MKEVKPITPSVIMATSPLICALLLNFFWRTSMTLGQKVGIYISFMGVVIVSTQGELSLLSLNLSCFWILAASLCFSLISIMNQKYIGHILALQATQWMTPSGTFFILCTFSPLMIRTGLMTFPYLLF